jgi:hypothetical protein
MESPFEEELAAVPPSSASGSWAGLGKRRATAAVENASHKKPRVEANASKGNEILQHSTGRYRYRYVQRKFSTENVPVRYKNSLCLRLLYINGEYVPPLEKDLEKRKLPVVFKQLIAGCSHDNDCCPPGGNGI